MFTFKPIKRWVKPVKGTNILISFSLDSPDVVLENDVKLSGDGYIIIDNGYQAGNYDNRFRRFKIRNGKVIGRGVSVDVSDNIRCAIDKILYPYLNKLKYSGYNDDDLAKIKNSVK